MAEKRKKFEGDLRFDSKGEPVNLLAYRLAQRLYWYQAVHDRHETLQEIYERLKDLSEDSEMNSAGIRRRKNTAVQSLD